MADLLRRDIDGPVATLTLNRPDKRNALNRPLIDALRDAFAEMADDETVRVLVLTGAGSAFSAGADLAALRAMQAARPMENQDDSTHLAELFNAIYRHPKPVIAKVNGHAIAGGCGLATICDFALATESAQLGFTEVRIGFVPAIVSVFVVRTLGETAARDLLLRGRLIDAPAAAEVGLITQAVSPGDLDGAVDKLAREIATETSGSAVRLTKRLLAGLPGMGLQEALDHAATVNAMARGTDDCQAGIEAFLNKNDPPWKKERTG